MTAETSLDHALRLIDAANAEDPAQESWAGRLWPAEWLYGRRLSEKLTTFEPEAGDELRLAARAQHIRRWWIPRESYPMDRAGYHRWRTRLYDHHAEQAGEILRRTGYPPAACEAVGDLLRKKRLRQDDRMQTLEDVICLVFLEFYFADFAAQHEEEKLIPIVQRTWKKMSPRGHEAALKLEMPESLKALVGRALA